MHQYSSKTDLKLLPIGCRLPPPLPLGAAKEGTVVLHMNK
jgi:hypothetical protein